MKFSEEIRKTLICFGEKIKTYYNKEKFIAYSLFKKIARNKEDLLDANTPDKIGTIVCSTYFVWVYCPVKPEKLDVIVRDKKKYIPLYQKYNKEIGCFQLIVVERS